jgi:DNA-binding response OmpR family regulator
LTHEGHVVFTADGGEAGLALAARECVDLILLDVLMPGLNGYEVLSRIKADVALREVPVLMISALDQTASVTRCIALGADDYLTKPFSVEHLSARMAAVLRRSRTTVGEAPVSTVIRVGGLAIDPLRRQAELEGVRLDLTRREFDLLAFLAGRPGVVVPRKELLAEVWQQAYGDDQTIDVHLSWLRRKLGETAARPRYLHTLRGVGVKLEPPRAERPL